MEVFYEWDREIRVRRIRGASMGNVTIETEIKCLKCKKMINRDRAAKNKYVCYECGYYFRVKTHNRIRMVADRKSFQPWFEEIEESNPLK